MQFAGDRVAVRVAGPRAVQRAAEVAARDGLQLVGQLHRQHPGLGERVGPAVDREHVRVGHVGLDVARALLLPVGLCPGQLVGTGDARQPHRRRDPVVADEAVAVPLGPALAQPHAEDHAAADEPVVGPGVFRVNWIRVAADAKEPSVQLLRDLPRDLEVMGRHFLRDGGEGTLQVPVPRCLPVAGAALGGLGGKPQVGLAHARSPRRRCLSRSRMVVRISQYHQVGDRPSSEGVPNVSRG